MANIKSEGQSVLFYVVGTKGSPTVLEMLLRMATRTPSHCEHDYRFMIELLCESLLARNHLVKLTVKWHVDVVPQCYEASCE